MQIYLKFILTENAIEIIQKPLLTAAHFKP